jgi:hypothetical protein
MDPKRMATEFSALCVRKIRTTKRIPFDNVLKFAVC